MCTEVKPSVLTRHKSSIFEAPELRRRIFRFAKRATLARCAAVCSAWSDCALDYLWRELDNPHPLFEVLSHLVLSKPGDGLLYFRTRLTDRNWERFRKYAQRVRELIIDEDLSAKLSTEAVMQLCCRGSTVCFTPKLTKLAVWPVESVFLDISILFMSDSLVELSLSIPIDRREVSEFFVQVITRAPRLKRLDYRSEFKQHLDMEIAELFSHLPELEIAHLPPGTSTAQSEAVLSRLPQVKGSFWDRSSGYVTRRVYFLQLSPHGFFLSLTKLELTADLSDVTKLISFTPNLGLLDLRSRSFENAETLHSFLETISCSCRSLLSLEINTISFPGWSFASLTDVLGRQCLDFSSRPFINLYFPKLTKFAIYWPVPLIFDDDKLVQFISSFPLIQRLRLNGHPVMLLGPLLTPNILHEIAKICPNIKCLSLYVDCTSRIPDCVTSVFESLEELDLGASPIDEKVNTFSNYLSRLCKPSCRFGSYGLGGFDDHVRENIMKEYVENYEKGSWAYEYQNIEELVQLFVKGRDDAMHSAAREREAVLKEKHVALKERDIFMEKWKAAEYEIARLRVQRDETDEKATAGIGKTERGG